MPFPLIPAGTKAGGYTIAKSLRFRSSASAYLSRTFTTPTNNKIFTWSGWVKIGTIPTAREGLFVGSNGATYFGLEFNASSQLNIYDSNVGGANIALTTNQVFRDPSSWYHIVMVVDTTQATAANRNKLYVNGVQITSFATAVYSPLNSSPSINSAVSHSCGSWTPAGAGLYFDGYLTEVNFIDGQALDPTYFGQTDTATGVWMPKAYTGSYGTNGFYLKFADASAATAAAIGKDSSGNGNNWTPSGGISVSAGVTYDSMVDTPTNYDNGGNGAGNYCVLNPLDSTVLTLAAGNLDASYATNADAYCTATMRVSSGKWYWENTINSVGGTYAIVGATSGNASAVALGSTASTYGYISSTGNKYNNGTATAYGSTYTNAAVVAVALDMDNGKIYFGLVSGGTITWQGSGDPVAGTNAAFTGLSGSFCAAINGRNTSSVSFNAGQRPFSASSLPSGYKALCTQNLPTPTIGATSSTLANKYFDVSIWSGTGSTQSITNSGGFQPDLLWGKARNVASSHRLMDAVRGIGTTYYKSLYSDQTAAEAEDDVVTAFTSTGFNLAGVSNFPNATGQTYVGWQWKANGSGTPNYQPSGATIPCTVSANVTAGFSVVTYTGNGANATVGHGLGVAPKMVFVKGRTNSTDGFVVWHTSYAATQYLDLHLTSAAATAATVWNSTAPTSSTFSIGTATGVNSSTVTYVAYCFAEVAGYSSFGSFTASGVSGDANFIYTGFLPRFILYKRTDAASSWFIHDTARQGYNVEGPELYPESSAAESTATRLDVLSNGFKIRAAAASNPNVSGATYIYACFAANPFKTSRAF